MRIARFSATFSRTGVMGERMRGNVMRMFGQTGVLLFAAAAAVLLANCSEKLPNLIANEEPKVAPNVFPKEYKRSVVNFVTQNEQNPIGIRDAAISEPALRQLENVERYVSCLRYTTRSGTQHERMVYFIGGQINQFVKTTPEQCSWANYTPFPELERICFGDKCKS
jgi:hypothetical protein